MKDNEARHVYTHKNNLFMCGDSFCIGNSMTVLASVVEKLRLKGDSTLHSAAKRRLAHWTSVMTF